jgi:predicted TPR repeat methyltransferase
MQARAFDQLAERYETAFADRPEQVQAASWLIEHLRPGSAVLDVGCGTGIPTARQLADAGMRIVGIDISAAMVTTAATAVPEAVIHKCDILDLAETDFDGAVAFFSLLMLPRSDILRALAILYAAIKPGGYLLISMVEADLDDEPIKFLDTDVRVSGYHRDELVRTVQQAGFDVLAMRVTEQAPTNGPADPETQLYIYSRRP